VLGPLRLLSRRIGLNELTQLEEENAQVNAGDDQDSYLTSAMQQPLTCVGFGSDCCDESLRQPSALMR
jgi:hypothetical protein